MLLFFQGSLLLIAASGIVLLERAQRAKISRRVRYAFSSAIMATRAASLGVALLPATFQWHNLSAQLNEFSTLTNVFLLSLLIAVAALGLAFWRTRGSFILSILLCSGAATATFFAFLLVQPGTRTVSALRAAWPLTAHDAGYFIGATLVFSTALSASQISFARPLFNIPPLEHRASNPLRTPFSVDTRSQIRLVSFSVILAFMLALLMDKKNDAALSVIATTALATAFYVVGWRNKQLRIKELATVFVSAFAATMVIGLLTRAIDLQLLPPLDKIAPDFILMIRNNCLAHTLLLAALICALIAALFLLHRPPTHLWTVLAHAPFWGWLLLAVLATATIVTVFLPQGNQIAFGLCSILIPTWAVVWLERAELSYEIPGH